MESGKDLRINVCFWETEEMCYNCSLANESTQIQTYKPRLKKKVYYVDLFDVAVSLKISSN